MTNNWLFVNIARRVYPEDHKLRPIEGYWGVRAEEQPELTCAGQHIDKMQINGE